VLWRPARGRARPGVRRQEPHAGHEHFSLFPAKRCSLADFRLVSSSEAVNEYRISSGLRSRSTAPRGSVFLWPSLPLSPAHNGAMTHVEMSAQQAPIEQSNRSSDVYVQSTEAQSDGTRRAEGGARVVRIAGAAPTSKRSAVAGHAQNLEYLRCRGLIS
jgi:hypothetical protein